MSGVAARIWLSTASQFACASGAAGERWVSDTTVTSTDVSLERRRRELRRGEASLEPEALQQVADVGSAVAWRGGRADGDAARGIIVRAAWRGEVKLVVDRGQRRQAEDSLD